MYGAPPPSPLARTASQPYVARWTSTSPGAGSSAFGSPGITEAYYYTGEPGAATRPSPAIRRPSKGPTYPILSIPVGTRKKQVPKKVVREDGTEETVLVDGSEDEEIYEKRKRLFYFDR